MGTFEWDILNPDRLTNLEINNKRMTSLFNLKIKKKSGSSINPDIHHSKVPSSGLCLSNTKVPSSGLCVSNTEVLNFEEMYQCPDY